MAEDFELPVTYRDKEWLLPAQLHQYGYSYKIEVTLPAGQAVHFEPDEERQWRALIDPETVSALQIDKALLAAIAQSLDAAFR